ncbi:KAP family NTPase [Ralstonia pseudosolanacearum]|uniref:KAP family NTPase n=1 Tax=Ralstonia pseudosolanacearum TaxID=1310165 RepID=UPI0020041B41|nr:KAP family NTPase [Ralstonia pseudosolanacearum]MCK4155235.1 hypothetical protein [Ralstonia pseudosolanacearum]
MTRGVIESVIADFLDSQDAEVLAISGRWGVGKTYALQSIVNRYAGTGSLGRYSYVSAFGVKSIGDLRSAILIKTRPLPVPKDGLAIAIGRTETAFSKGRGKAIWEAIRALTDRIPYVGKPVTVLLETIATSLINKTVVCIDDIERLGSGVTMDELMGLVSELKFESHCKFILLFNEEQLGEREAQYRRASEKVVDKKLSFVTSPEDAIEMGLPQQTPLRDYAASCIQKLGISNIRTVQKIAGGLAMIHGVIHDSSETVKKQAAITVTVFAGSLYEGGVGFPAPEKITGYNWFSTKMEVGEKAIDEAWIEKLHACEFLTSDEFDREILAILRKGYVHGSKLADLARELDAVADRERLNKIFTSAWAVFHDRIDGSADELVRGFVAAVDVAATVISSLNLNSTVKLIRELGYDAEADAVIETYIARNAGHPATFKIDDSPWCKDVDDETLLRRFSEVLVDEEGPLDLADAASLLVEGNQWSDRMLAALLKASPDDYVKLLTDNQGDALRVLIDALYRVAGLRGEESAPIAATLRAALDQIAKASALNEIRVRRWRR